MIARTSLFVRLAACVLALATFWAAPCRAAPFCVEVPGLFSQCIYFDAVECQRRAFQLSGVCNANPKELVLPVGTGKFCLVGQNRESQCVYSDRNTCQSAATALGGVCVDNATVGLQANPYANEPNNPY